LDKLKRESSVPLYAQLGDILRERISSGEWKVDQMIPSENDLARMYGISRVTVRSVVNELANDGLLYRVQGKGTFVARSKLEMYGPAWGGVSRQLIASGKTITTTLIDFALVTPSDYMAKKLGITKDTLVRYICRVRYADGEPISIHKTWIPNQLCESLKSTDVVETTLCDVMNYRFGLHSQGINETLEVVHATDFEAQLLNIEVGAPVILMEGLGLDKVGHAYQLAKIIFSGDRVKLKFDYGVEQQIE